MTTRTTAKKAARKIEETYRDPRRLAEAGLRYFVDRTGQHVVVIDLPAGHDLIPTVRRFGKIEDARQGWKDARSWLVGQGYSEKV
jgi:hypothetical protein